MSLFFKVRAANKIMHASLFEIQVNKSLLYFVFYLSIFALWMGLGRECSGLAVNHGNRTKLI